MPETVTAVGLTVKTIPSAVIISAPAFIWGGAIVVVGSSTPAVPSRMVSVPITICVGVAPGPMG